MGRVSVLVYVVRYVCNVFLDFVEIVSKLGVNCCVGFLFVILEGIGVCLIIIW